MAGIQQYHAAPNDLSIRYRLQPDLMHRTMNWIRNDVAAAFLESDDRY